MALGPGSQQRKPGAWLVSSRRPPWAPAALSTGGLQWVWTAQLWGARAGAGSCPHLHDDVEGEVEQQVADADGQQVGGEVIGADDEAVGSAAGKTGSGRAGQCPPGGQHCPCTSCCSHRHSLGDQPGPRPAAEEHMALAWGSSFPGAHPLSELRTGPSLPPPSTVDLQGPVDDVAHDQQHHPILWTDRWTDRKACRRARAHGSHGPEPWGGLWHVPDTKQGAAMKVSMCQLQSSELRPRLQHKPSPEPCRVGVQGLAGQGCGFGQPSAPAAQLRARGPKTADPWGGQARGWLWGHGPSARWMCRGEQQGEGWAPALTTYMGPLHWRMQSVYITCTILRGIPESAERASMGASRAGALGEGREVEPMPQGGCPGQRRSEPFPCNTPQRLDPDPLSQGPGRATSATHEVS